MNFHKKILLLCTLFFFSIPFLQAQALDNDSQEEKATFYSPTDLLSAVLEHPRPVILVTLSTSVLAMYFIYPPVIIPTLVVIVELAATRTLIKNALEVTRTLPGKLGLEKAAEEDFLFYVETGIAIGTAIGVVAGLEGSGGRIEGLDARVVIVGVTALLAACPLLPGLITGAGAKQIAKPAIVLVEGVAAGVVAGVTGAGAATSRIALLCVTTAVIAAEAAVVSVLVEASGAVFLLVEAGVVAAIICISSDLI